VRRVGPRCVAGPIAALAESIESKCSTCSWVITWVTLLVSGLCALMPTVANATAPYIRKHPVQAARRLGYDMIRMHCQQRRCVQERRLAHRERS
jgi:hypothetical protein